MPGQFLLHLCALAVGAVTPAPLPIRVPVSAVVANETSALALTEDGVRMMDGAGFPLGRFPLTSGAMPVSPARHRRAGTAFAAAGVLDDGDFNDPHDPDSEIEDPDNILVEDDRPARLRARGVPASRGVALAVGASAAWVGRDDGLWRLPPQGGAERAVLPAAGPVRQLAASPNGRVIVAALDGAIVRSDDGGARFEPLVEVSGPVSRLVVTDSGQAFALAGERLMRLGAGPPSGEVLSRGVEDVTTCGGDALALMQQRRLTVVSGTASSRDDEPGAPGAGQEDGPGVPPGAARLACSPDGRTWVVYGAALWVSEDRGRTWTARDDLGGGYPIAAVAVSPLALWVASAGGLAVLPLRAPSPSPLASRRPSAGTALGDESAPPVTPTRADCLVAARGRWWLSALPRVDLDFATARSSARREVRVFILLSFTFEARWDARAERSLEAAVRTAERREAAQRAMTRPEPGGRESDPTAAEERNAVARLLD